MRVFLHWQLLLVADDCGLRILSLRASTCSTVSSSIASHIGIIVAKLVRELTHESQLQRAMTENAGLRAKFERLRKELDFTSNYELVRKSRILQISSEISTRGYSFGSVRRIERARQRDKNSRSQWPGSQQLWAK